MCWKSNVLVTRISFETLQLFIVDWASSFLPLYPVVQLCHWVPSVPLLSLHSLHSLFTLSSVWSLLSSLRSAWVENRLCVCASTSSFSPPFPSFLSPSLSLPSLVSPLYHITRDCIDWSFDLPDFSRFVEWRSTSTDNHISVCITPWSLLFASSKSAPTWDSHPFSPPPFGYRNHPLIRLSIGWVRLSRCSRSHLLLISGRSLITILILRLRIEVPLHLMERGRPLMES